MDAELFNFCLHSLSSLGVQRNCTPPISFVPDCEAGRQRSQRGNGPWCYRLLQLVASSALAAA